MKLPKPPNKISFSFIFSDIERAILEEFGIRKFSKEDMLRILEFFEMESPECVYCGNKDVKRWDHLIPVRKHGETVIGNLVPSCSSCDDSKGSRNFEDWARGTAPKSPSSKGISDLDSRIQKIYDYMEFFNYEPIPLEKKLSRVEREELDRLRKTIQDTRADLENLRDKYLGRIDQNS